jgi:hypothetical protein
MTEYGENAWAIRKRADQLRPGDRFIFDDSLGGEGAILTVESINPYYGTVEVWTEEEGYSIGMTDKTFVTIAPEEKP